MPDLGASLVGIRTSHTVILCTMECYCGRVPRNISQHSPGDPTLQHETGKAIMANNELHIQSFLIHVQDVNKSQALYNKLFIRLICKDMVPGNAGD